MCQDPTVDESIIIDGKSYVFIQVADAPGIVYGEIGKKAKVYRVMEGTKAFALKVFKPLFRNPRTANNSELISTYLTIPGLAVAQRTILTPGNYPDLINSHPEFSYSVLMPWIEGKSWVNFINGRVPITRKEGLNLVNGLINIVSGLEERNMAHCDLSGGNFIFSNDFNQVELIDIEDLFAVGIQPPDPLPAGTSGYSPDWVKRSGLWEAGADRFAISVLIGEILGWQFEDVRTASSAGDSYFAEGEYGHDSKRYNLLIEHLSQIHPEIPDFFRAAWLAQNPSECPPVSEWRRVIGLISTKAGTLNCGWDSLELPNDLIVPGINNLQPILAVEPHFTASAIETRECPEKKSLTCPSCGKDIMAEWVECPYCRFDLLNKEVKQESPGITQNKSPEEESSRRSDVVVKEWPAKGGGKVLKSQLLGKIFLIFVALGVGSIFLIVISGGLITQIAEQLRKTSGASLTFAISNSFLALLVGCVYSWVFRCNIRKNKVWLFILVSSASGLIGGMVSGSIVQSGGSDNPFLIGAVTGFVSGSISSLGQNILMESKGMQRKWFLYSMISWLAIWSIGTPISWDLNSILGMALSAAFIITASGGTLAIFLNKYPEIEF